MRYVAFFGLLCLGSGLLLMNLSNWPGFRRGRDHMQSAGLGLVAVSLATACLIAIAEG